MKVMMVFYAYMAAVAFIVSIVMFYTYNGIGFIAYGLVGMIASLFHIIYGKLA